MNNKAWTKGVYDCCNGNANCTVNQTKKLVDHIADLFATDPDNARGYLADRISEREEDRDYWKMKAKELMGVK